jgi:hypothetical protein
MRYRGTSPVSMPAKNGHTVRAWLPYQQSLKLIVYDENFVGFFTVLMRSRGMGGASVPMIVKNSVNNIVVFFRIFSRTCKVSLVHRKDKNNSALIQ